MSSMMLACIELIEGFAIYVALQVENAGQHEVWLKGCNHGFRSNTIPGLELIKLTSHSMVFYSGIFSSVQRSPGSQMHDENTDEPSMALKPLISADDVWFCTSDGMHGRWQGKGSCRDFQG